MKKEEINTIRQRAESWLDANIDENTRKDIREMLEHDEERLIEAFYKDLQFGTGGMRGIMGTGSNRINKYTIGMATQGLANYLKKTFTGDISVAIACDSRNHSQEFAEIAAHILSANQIQVYLFDALRPTPLLSYTIRHLKCQSGIVITASHNPKEYNGYKVYWEDGGQIVPPHDAGIINEVQSITSINEIRFEADASHIKTIGEEVDTAYLEALQSLSLSPKAIQEHKDMKIVFTPIHGTGYRLVPDALKAFGFTSVHSVEAQDMPDGNFPTVDSPNPENPEAFQLALEEARKLDADLIMGTDPDADRVGIIVKKTDGTYQLLNGNQTAAILVYYLIKRHSEQELLHGSEYVVKTIVTTELLSEITEKYHIDCYDTLTGFKYIAAKIRELEGRKTFLGGGEESYGYLAGEFVRDKDAVMSCALIAEVAAWSATQGKTLYDILLDIYVEFNMYKEKLVSVVKKGRDGALEIEQMMKDFRHNTPESIVGANIMLIHDYQKQKSFDMISALRYDIQLPKSNVLQFILSDGTKISIRPSGTEPKIKFYISVKAPLASKAHFENTDRMLEEKIEAICQELHMY